MFEMRHAITAYWRARRLRTKADLKHRQRISLHHWLHNSVPRVPRYAGFRGKLDDLPMMDKVALMADFGSFNTAGIDADAGWAAFAGDKRIGDYIIGASTGTSGNRGLFVISQAERYRWLGTILAKALPGFWRQRHRIAVILPLNTPLYDSANRTKALRLKFFDLAEDWTKALINFDPTVIIAPPKILVHLAQQRTPISPKHIFSGAEQLDLLDRHLIAEYFTTTIREIYMATEGLFAVSCPLGTLHLCEDTMHFELPPVGDDPNLREVIISDFSRTTQIMARYRMNDLVRLAAQPCPCGSPLMAISEVVGRRDDCFRLGAHRVLITPDLIRNAIVDSDRRITDFRVTQTGPNQVVLQTDVAGHVALDGLISLFRKKGANVNVLLSHEPMIAPKGRKLRRVKNACAS
ncbi:CoF synthetase [Yoonia sp. 2307UL14-13]|uniref:CoF synthetase n=1 Tax=Yoonia sp. 2307UL14-13 TaxID=3126506 RepID=UPI003099D540